MTVVSGPSWSPPPASQRGGDEHRRRGRASVPRRRSHVGPRAAARAAQARRTPAGGDLRRLRQVADTRETIWETSAAIAASAASTERRAAAREVGRGAAATVRPAPRRARADDRRRRPCTGAPPPYSASLTACSTAVRSAGVALASGSPPAPAISASTAGRRACRRPASARAAGELGGADDRLAVRVLELVVGQVAGARRGSPSGCTCRRTRSSSRPQASRIRSR